MERREGVVAVRGGAKAWMVGVERRRARVVNFIVVCLLDCTV
jgi:hypothetical protein